MLLKRTQDELNRLKSQMSQNDLNIVTEQLELTEERAKLGMEKRELVRANAVLEKSLKEQEQLVAQTSHELKATKAALEVTRKEAVALKDSSEIA